METFADENNQFLLKVLYSNKQRKFFCYKPSGELLTNYYLTIYPSEEEIHLQAETEWIEFSDEMIIENIKVEIKS